MRIRHVAFVLVLGAALAGAARAEQNGPTVTAATDSALPVRLVVSPASKSGSHTAFTLRVENLASTPIIATTIRYTHLDASNIVRGGRETSFYAAVNEQMIAPGQSRLMLQALEGLRGNVTATVDFVAYADGSTYGEDRSGSSKIVQATLLAQRRLLETLLRQAKEKGAAGNDLEAIIERELNGRARVLRRVRSGELDVAALPR